MKKEISKILFIASLYRPHNGGVETVIEELARCYKQHGIGVVVLTKRFPEDLPEREVVEGMPVYRIKSPKREEDFCQVIDWLKKYEQDLKADIVHIIGVRRPLPFIGLLLSKWWNVPYLVNFSGGDILDPGDPITPIIWEEGKYFVPQSIIQADFYVAFSKDIRKRVVKNIKELKEQKINIIYSGANLQIIDSYKKNESRRPYLIAVRRLVYSKGVDLLIEAFSRICNDYPDIDLKIIGNGPEKENLVRLTGKLNISDRVEFLGEMEHEKIYPYLKGALVNICPSRGEGGGNINLEAQAAGCLAVGSDAGGVPEYIEDGKTGFLFKSENIDDLVKILKMGLNNQNLRDRIIKQAKESVKKFDWPKVSDNYLNLYDKIFKNFRPKKFIPWSIMSQICWNKLRDFDIKKDQYASIMLFKKNLCNPYEFIKNNYSCDDLKLTLLRESKDNIVYLIEQGEDNKIFRISKRLPLNDILFEIEALKVIKDNKLPVASPLANRWGMNFSVSPEGVIGVMFESKKGYSVECEPDKKPSLDYVKTAGQILGKLHFVASRNALTNLKSRNIFTELGRVAEYKVFFETEFEGGKLFIQEVNEMINFGKKSKEVEGWIHNDFRPHNLLFESSNQVSALLDFDWSCEGPFIKDLALALAEWSYPDGAQESWTDIFDTFLNAYNETAPWSIEKNSDLYKWIGFACLSDAATYFCDLISMEENNSTNQRISRSYMYKKYKYFMKQSKFY